MIIKTNRCVACNELFDSDSIVIEHCIQYFPKVEVLVHEKCYKEIYDTDKYPLLRSSVEEILRRIYSNRKRAEVLEVLNTSYPAHFVRVWLASFLRFAVGLSIEETCFLIKEKCQWSDYDMQTTRQQVASIHSVTQRELVIRSTPSEAYIGRPIPCFTIPKDAETIEDGDWIGIKSGCGIVLDWIRKSSIIEM